MEFVIVLLMAACCVVALKTGRESLTVKLGALSVNIVAAFAIVMSHGDSGLAVALFVFDLAVSPWVVFWSIKSKAE